MILSGFGIGFSIPIRLNLRETKQKDIVIILVAIYRIFSKKYNNKEILLRNTWMDILYTFFKRYN